MYFMRPKTIQIFLPDGSPRSIRIAEITSRIAKAVQIPRNKIKEAGTREEVSQPGVYFLFGYKDDSENIPAVYIGEAENSLKRITQHNQSLEFWHTAIILISKTNHLTKSHIKYLESYSYEITKKLGRYDVINSSIPSKPHITETVEADLHDYFDDSRVLLSTLGYPIFEEIKIEDKRKLIYCEGKGAKATGFYSDDGLMVMKNSTASIEETKTVSNWIKNLRKDLIGSNVLIKENDFYRFEKDYLFKSPSSAAASVLGREANGWIEWKDEKGNNLNQIKR